jgi:hypothetical protein
MAARSLAKDAAQTVMIPFKVGNTLVAVDIPTHFCAAVDSARLAPKAAHPVRIGKAASGSRWKLVKMSSCRLFVMVFSSRRRSKTSSTSTKKMRKSPDR